MADPTMEKFLENCLEGSRLFHSKNLEYGDAFEIYGVLGVVCEILGAANRLPQLVLYSQNHGIRNYDSIRNVLIDLHNFANMGLICLDKGNYDGRRPNDKQHDS